MPSRPSRARVAALAAVLSSAALTVGAAAPARAQFTHTPQATATGSGGAAATVDSVATAAAIDVLKRGGNAVDATVAAAAVLGVTEPFSCGIGGGGFMVIRSAGDKRHKGHKGHKGDRDYRGRDGQKGRGKGNRGGTKGATVTTIDSRELSPAAMKPDSFINPATGTPLPFAEARYSGLSAGVPGTVAGWQKALDKYGTKRLGQLLEPAIRVARDGFVIDQTFFSQVEGNKDFFDDIPSSASLFLDADGTPKDVGTVLKNPDLAKTYAAIARKGPKAFYRGDTAEAIVAAATKPPTAPNANHTWRPGLMSEDDLKRYEAIERAPTHVNYRGLDVYSMGPPSSGGSTVGEALNILEGFDINPADRVNALHLFLEASRFSFADRNTWLADPAFFDVPLRGLLSDGYAAQRRSLINPQQAATSPVPAGDPRPFNGTTKTRRGKSAATVTRQGSTTHLTVSDRRGNVVAYTFTIESTGGNGIVVPGHGFLLNNELTDFNYDSPTHPNGPDARKRPRSSMAPTIVQKDGKPLLALGTPGGSTIITTVLQILVERLDLDRPLPDAIATPRAAQRNTAATSAEPAFIAAPETAALQARGHTFSNGGEIGAATGIEFLPDGRTLAAAEPARRGGGSAQVVAP